MESGHQLHAVTDLRLRATRSRDIRAANINELFSGQSQFTNTITNPLTNFSATTRQLTGGNPDLTPEEADTLTAGFVYQAQLDSRPAFLRRLVLDRDRRRHQLAERATNRRWLPVTR